MIIDFLPLRSSRLRIRFLHPLHLGLLFAGLLIAQSVAAGVADEDCLNCHEDKDLKDNSDRSLFVDKVQFGNSIHGRSGISCVSCHC